MDQCGIELNADGVVVTMADTQVTNTGLDATKGRAMRLKLRRERQGGSG